MTHPQTTKKNDSSYHPIKADLLPNHVIHQKHNAESKNQLHKQNSIKFM